MSDCNSVVAPFEFYNGAEAAVRELQQSGFDMRKLSLVARDYHSEEHVVGCYNTGDRMAYWAGWEPSGAAFEGCCLAPRFSSCRALVRCL